jgi:cobalt-zinc-cadmium resistance protein CzcA
VIILIVSAYYIIPKLPSGFLPQMDEGSMVLDFSSPPGTSLENTDKMLDVVDNILKNTPEVKSYARQIGTQNGFFITEPNNGDYTIQLNKKRNKTTEEVANDIRKQIESKLPALRVDFGQIIEDMLGDLMSTKQPISVLVFGDDQSKIEEIANKVADIINSVNGTADVFNGITIAGPQIIFNPKNTELAKYGLTPNDLQFQLNIRMFDGKKYNTMNDLKHSFIFLNDGSIKPIKEFADIQFFKGVAEVDRENLKQMFDVVGRLNNRDLGSTLTEIQNKISQQIKLPTGYEIVYGGAYKEQQKAFSELIGLYCNTLFIQKY